MARASNYDQERKERDRAKAAKKAEKLAARIADKLGPEADAKGQSESNHAGGSNDGVSSANPRVLSGNDEGDATFPFKKPIQGN